MAPDVGAALRGLITRARRTPTLPAVRAGVIGAAVSVAGSYARGLLPRTAKDQALATGVTMSLHYLLTASSAAAAETVALYASGDHTVRDRRPPPNALIATDTAFIGLGIAAQQLFKPDPDEPMVRSLVRSGGYFAMLGGATSIVVTTVDELLKTLPGTRNWHNRSLLLDAALGGGLAAFGIMSRRRRAQRYGLVEPDRPAVERANIRENVKAAAVGLAGGAGLLAVAGAEQWLAHRTERLLRGHIGSVEIGSPWLGHIVAVTIFGAAGVVTLSTVKRRVERGGDVVEAAYPEPPTSPEVTAGPQSLIGFDTIGKEGRRFVLMALTPEEISAVMGEPARPPIRIVAGYESAATTKERADLCLAEMEALGAFDRDVICVASPTGVGYVSYVFTETLEYLTLGDCATVMPQYALVPSALALNDTGEGAVLQRMVLAGIARRVADRPVEQRPRVVQFGESLGAQVALDVAHPEGSDAFDDLGVHGGLYLGVPFRTQSWMAWVADRARFDPAGTMVAVSEPAVLAELEPERLDRMRHLMVIHHDDPVNKFGYRQVVRPPWWMGSPASRPPKVPREVLWRPITTFVLTLIDLKNGMKLSPGKFVRRGHDYRIDTVDAVRAAFRLECTPEQEEAIQEALRRREVEWAKRRLIARKFAAAREAIASTLNKWGAGVASLDSLPDLEAGPLVDVVPEPEEQLSFVVADHDPATVA